MDATGTEVTNSKKLYGRLCRELLKARGWQSSDKKRVKAYLVRVCNEKDILSV